MHTNSVQWIAIDSKVYDISKFANLHPGGAGVLLTSSIGTPMHCTSGCMFSTYVTTCPAGQDATQAFFGLHRHEVLLRPQYARLQIGVVEGQEESIKPQASDGISGVPYAEPMWLSQGYHSPYYKDSHRKVQKVMRKFVNEVVYPEAVKCEDNGKRISQEVVDKIW